MQRGKKKERNIKGKKKVGLLYKSRDCYSQSLTAAVAGTQPIFIMKFSLNYTYMLKYQSKIESYEGNLKIRKSG